MFRLALTMLINERGKYLGIVAALSFTALMMAQQPAMFVGILSRATALIDDIPAVDLWVMDSNVQYVDDSKPMQDAQLYRVKGIAGVEWAVPFYAGTIQARLPDGNFRNCILYGIDDATFIGGPARMIEGRIGDLRLSDGWRRPPPANSAHSSAWDRRWSSTTCAPRSWACTAAPPTSNPSRSSTRPTTG